MYFKTLTALSLVAAALSTAAAQETRRLAEAEAVPMELATALAGSFGFGGVEPQILVGSMPDWATNRLIIPSNGRLIGSGFFGPTVVAVVSVPGAPDSAITDLRRQFLQRGWKNPPPQTFYGVSGGFRPAQFAPSAATNPAANGPLCGDQQMLMINASRRRTGGSTVIYHLYSGSGNNACHPVQPPPQTYHSPFPTLYNPVEAGNSYNTGNCSGYQSNGTSVTLEVAMTPQAVLDHYGKQIVDSGWTAGASIAGRTWTKKDSTGAPTEMTMTVTPSAQVSGCARVELQVKSFKKP